MRGLALLAVLAALAAAMEPVPVVFDTDMGNDIDDALALAMLHALESRGECRIIAVTVTKDHRLAAPFCDLVNHFFQRPGIPIGVVKNGKTPEDSAYLSAVCRNKLYPRRIEDGRQAPEAGAVLRRVLAAEKDGSVVVVQVGFSTNLARLLDSEPELVRRKVRLLSVMAGNFRDPKFAEYNVEVDVPAAQKVFSEWPGEVVFSGFEVGESMRVPARGMDAEYAWTANHPVVDGYRVYKKPPYDSPTWDLTAVLYAVRPGHGYFSLSPPGRVRVDAGGRTRHEPAAGGRHRHLMVNDAQRARALEAMTMLASQPVVK